MNAWTGDIIVAINPHTEWTHEITLTCTIRNQRYRHQKTYPGLNCPDWSLEYFRTRRLNITEAVAYAIVEFGDYILSYESAQLKYEAAFDNCWRD